MKKKLRKATVNVIDEQFNPRPRRILVPLDFSDPSRRALCFAGHWAKLFEAQVFLLHVAEPVPFMSGLEDVPLAMSPREVAQTAKQALTKLAETDLPKDIQRSVLVRRGKAYDQIVAAAQSLKIDLIIIATQGYTGLSKMLLGSTAERVVRYAHCPVLTVRRRPR